MAPAKSRNSATEENLQAQALIENSGSPDRSKVLRVGVVVSGKIIDEKIFVRGSDVSIGSSERNDFTLTDELLPSRYRVFEHSGDKYFLNVADFMGGRVFDRGRCVEVSNVDREASLRGSGRRRRLELTVEARGTVVVGETTLLFQMVQRPASAPLPQLPASVRGGWVGNIDWFFGALLLASFVAQLSFVTWLVYRDWPVQPSFEVRARVYDTPPSRVDIDRVREALRRGADAPPGAEIPAGAEPVAAVSLATPSNGAPRRSSAPGSSGSPDPSAEQRLRAALDRSAREALGRIDIIGSANPNADGAVVDVLRGGGVQLDQDRLLAEITGVRVATSGEETTFRRPVDGREHARNGTPDGQFSLRTEPTDQDVRTAAVEERRVAASSTPGTVTVAPSSRGDLDPTTVRRVVTSNMGGIAACYERPLQRDHSLAGRVTVSFTVDQGGRVTRASVVRNTVAPEVGPCIEARFRALRFPAPEGGPATFEFPIIFQPAAR